MFGRTAALSLVLSSFVGLVPVARAQPSGVQQARAAGRAAGWEVGDARGHEEGRTDGQLRVLTAAYVHGFRSGLSTPVGPYLLEEAHDTGWELGFSSGESAGHPVGLSEGRSRAAQAHGQLQGRPQRPYFESPPPPPSVASTRPGCDGPRTVRIDWAGSGVSLNLARLDRDGSPFERDHPEPKIPSSKLRKRAAQRAGFSTEEEIVAWAIAHREAHVQAWHEAYRAEQDSVSRWRRQEYRRRGRSDGAGEGTRRALQDAFARSHEWGLARGHDEGFRIGAAEGWDEVSAVHEAGPVFNIESAEIVDDDRDGVLEPGEIAHLLVTVANAGLVDADAEHVAIRGIAGLQGQGQVARHLPAQERRTQERELGVVDAGAALGSSVLVELLPTDGAPLALSAAVGRPVVLDEVSAKLDARDGRTIIVTRAQLRSVANRSTDRSLQLVAGDLVRRLEVLGASERRTVELEQGIAADVAFHGPTVGSVVLREAGASDWMRAGYDVVPSVGRAMELAPELDDPRPAVEFVSAQLLAELREAQGQPKLYKRRGDGSALASYARGLVGMPTASRRLFVARVSAPLLEAAASRATPRKVRKAIRRAIPSDV